MKFAEAFVELRTNTRPLRDGLRSAVRDVRQATSRMASAIRKTLGGAFRFAARIGAIIGTALTAGGVAMVKFASDAEETNSRFAQVFGSLTREADTFAKRLGSSVGRSTVEIRDSLATFQSFFVGLGFGRREAANFSQEMSSLAIDFASFNNLADAEGVQRFISALSGSGEVLDRFGVNIKEAALNQQLLAMGFKTTTQGATEQQKAMARMAIIADALGRSGAVGDAERTAGSFANQLKRLKATVTEAAVTLGNDLLPAATKVVGFLSEKIPELAEGAQVIVRAVKFAFENVTAIFSVIRLRTKAFTLSIGDEIRFLKDIFMSFGEFMSSNWLAVLQRVFNTIITASKNVALAVSRALAGDVPGAIAAAASGVGALAFDFADAFNTTKGLIPEKQRNPAIDALNGIADGIIDGLKTDFIDEITRRDGPLTGTDQPSAAPQGIASQIAESLRGITTSVQAATGTFQVAQRSPVVAVLERIEDRTEEQLAVDRDLIRLLEGALARPF